MDEKKLNTHTIGVRLTVLAADPVEPSKVEKDVLDRLMDDAARQALSSQSGLLTVEVLNLQLGDWYKQVLFGGGWLHDRPPEEQARAYGAITAYMLRRLSRGHLPKVATVMDVLEGRRAVPTCGYIDCSATDDHTH